MFGNRSRGKKNERPERVGNVQPCLPRLRRSDTRQAVIEACGRNEQVQVAVDLLQGMEGKAFVSFWFLFRLHPRGTLARMTHPQLIFEFCQRCNFGTTARARSCLAEGDKWFLLAEVSAFSVLQTPYAGTVWRLLASSTDPDVDN